MSASQRTASNNHEVDDKLSGLRRENRELREQLQLLQQQQLNDDEYSVPSSVHYALQKTIGPSVKKNYNGTLVTLLLAIIFNIIYHHSSDDLLLPTPQLSSHQKNQTKSSIGDEGSFPRWEYMPNTQPYMGNLSCIFEAMHWDIESQVDPTELDRRRTCGKYRYLPHSSWVAPDPLVVFEKLPNEATIYIVGDSVSNQHYTDLTCYLASVSRIVEVDLEPELAKVPRCEASGDCKGDYRGQYAGLNIKRATFQSYRGDTKKQIHVARASGNFGAMKSKHTHSHFRNFIASIAKKDDILVLNGGLHYKDGDRIPLDLEEIKPALINAMNDGMRVLWRETGASHFNTTDGYYTDPTLKALQEVKSAHCVSHTLINATANRNFYNGKVTPLMKSFGVHVLETWEASFLNPAFCHVGGGVDCGHTLQPGGTTSYYTESLLKYIEEM